MNSRFSVICQKSEGVVKTRNVGVENLIEQATYTVWEMSSNFPFLLGSLFPQTNRLSSDFRLA